MTVDARKETRGFQTEAKQLLMVNKEQHSRMLFQRLQTLQARFLTTKQFMFLL